MVGFSELMDKKQLPKISIITPSYNQAIFIEQTIQSVLDQQYPLLEYWVIDGSSTDGTLQILKKYEKYLSWTSEPDKGQADAINKGLSRASGEVVAFLNSDDLYNPGSLQVAGEYFASHLDAQWLSGRCINIDSQGKPIRFMIRQYKNFWLRINSYKMLFVLNYISQPSTFWRRRLLDEVGYLNTSLYYTMDYEYWLRIGKHYQLHVLNKDLARFRIHSGSKSGATAHRQFDEELQVAMSYNKNQFLTGLHRIHLYLTVAIYTKYMNFAGSRARLG